MSAIRTTVSPQRCNENKKRRRSDFAGLSNDSDTKSGVDEFVNEFIIEMAEARLMDLEEGKIAQQKCTTKELKSYGTLMVKDQTEMLHEIKKMAARKNISLPPRWDQIKPKV